MISFSKLSSKFIMLAYLLLQMGATGFLLAIQMQKSWLILHLVFTCITSAFYIVVHLRQPGYLKSVAREEQKNQAKRVAEDGEPPLTQDRIQKERKAQNPPQQIEAEGPFESSKQIMSKRFCRLCQIQQPIRAKHCYQCEKCVSTFDHHCPWMDTCIGQKNRGLFSLYLLFQVIEIFNAGVYTAHYSLSGISFMQDFIVIILALFLLFFALSGLLGFHIYLMVFNVTTWEFLKWKEIPYLTEKDKKNSHPFSKGWKNNLIEYWEVTISSEKKVWEIQPFPPVQQKKSQDKKKKQQQQNPKQVSAQA